MLWLVALLLAPPAEAGRRHPFANVVKLEPVEIPPPPSEPVARGPADSPLDRPEDEALSGKAGAVALSLVRSTITYTFPVDLGVLDSIGQSTVRPLVLQHLAADPRWRVTRYQGAWVALRRDLERGRWSAPRDGHHLDKGGQWRAVLRFGSWDQRYSWSNSELIARSPARERRVQVTAFTPPTLDAGQVSTALSAEGESVALEIFERGPETDRPHTAELLGEIPYYLSGLVERSQLIEAMGFDPPSMPARAMGKAPATLDVGSPGEGELEVVGWQNPGSLGWTWVRLVTLDGKPWEEALVRASTRELVGFSRNARQTFYLQARFPVPTGASFVAVAEVWHQPLDEGAPRLLGRHPVRVPAR